MTQGAFTPPFHNTATIKAGAWGEGQPAKTETVCWQYDKWYRGTDQGSGKAAGFPENPGGNAWTA